MTRLTKIVAAVLIGIGLIIGTLGYTVLRAPQEASAPITAIPLASASTSGSNVAANNATSAAADSSRTAVAASPAETPDVILAQIVPAESEARFVIDEVLNNAPKTVIGTTDQVAGEIAVNPDDPSQTRVGSIRVNARTLTTDNDFRNRAIKNRILSTDQYEFVTFMPTQIIGLPTTGAVGDTYTFQIAGDLTVRDVTGQVTFDATVTPVSETRLEGTAQATIRYADWRITIPQVRQVASVSDHVRLEIDFVAVPQ